MPLTVLAHILVLLVGIGVIWKTATSAIQTFVLPRGISDQIARGVFLGVRAIFDLRTNRADSYPERDRIMAFYAPIALLSLTSVWLVLVLLGYTAIYWSLGIATWRTAFLMSGSSLLTLGFAGATAPAPAVLVFAEAAMGLLLAALLITYLPTIYAAWQRREQQVALLEVRAGSPPSAWDMILRYHRLLRLEAMADLWPALELWFIDIEESHTSLASLPFFRSPQPERSWVAAAGVVLDTASLLSSAVDVPHSAERQLCIRAGYIALRRIAHLFRIPYDPDPAPTDQISVTRPEFDEVCDLLASEGLPMVADRDQAWRDFAGWRVNYDAPLLALATLTMASYAPWISDRSAPWRHPYSPRWSRLRPRLFNRARTTE